MQKQREIPYLYLALRLRVPSRDCTRAAGDEALGCFLLKKLEEYRYAEIVRSRDPAILESCDIVLDVGSVYDSGKAPLLFPGFFLALLAPKDSYWDNKAEDCLDRIHEG